MQGDGLGRGGCRTGALRSQRTGETTTKDLIALYHSHFGHNTTRQSAHVYACLSHDDTIPVASARRARRGPETKLNICRATAGGRQGSRSANQGHGIWVNR